ALDFDDLLVVTVELFREKPDILGFYQHRFRNVMVDEFQDTNIAQYEIVKLLTKESRNLCVVGDEDQSIYSWRSADIRNILNFETDFLDLKVVVLEQNYRSTDTILKVARAIIASNKLRKEKNLWTENEAGLPVTVHEAYNEQDVQPYEAMLRIAGLRYDDSDKVAAQSPFGVRARELFGAFIDIVEPLRQEAGTRSVFELLESVLERSGYARYLQDGTEEGEE